MNIRPDKRSVVLPLTLPSDSVNLPSSQLHYFQQKEQEKTSEYLD